MSFWNAVGGAVGGIGGFLVGGPAGAAIGAGLGIGVGGATDAANAQEDAANTAAGAQRYATDRSIAFQKEQADQTRKDFQPYQLAGYDALEKLKDFKPGESPAAQWQLQQGTKALNRQLAARGLLGGGNAASRLSELQQGITANDYNAQYNRLTDMLKVGQGAAGSINNAGQNAANANSIAMQNLGNGLASSATNIGNAQASLYSGMGGAVLNSAALGIKAGLFGNNTPQYGQPTVPDYNPNNIYAGSSPGPWAAGGIS